MVGVARVVAATRWPRASVIRAVRAALERGDWAALHNQRLQYACRFFGIDARPPGWRGRRPRATVLTAAQEAYARGDSFALGGKRLRYAAAYLGLSLPPVSVDGTPRQRAARWNWTKRREAFGPNGLSPAAEHAMKLNLVAAAIAKRRTPKRTHCQRGHKWTAENTRLNAKGRSCRACERITRAERKRKRDEWKKRRDALVEARQRMLEAGIKSNQQPDSKYWRDRYVAARDRWQQLKKAA